MKRPKDRLHRVIVIGATPAGIAATNKLGEIGIPVTLVDTDFDLNRKLARSEWRLKTGVPFNFAHRSGLIRIMRNSNIQCLLPAEVDSIKHTPQGFRVQLKNTQTFIDPGKCTLCGRCYEACPAYAGEEGKAIKLNCRHSLPGRVMIHKLRRPPCQENCPLGVNAQGYITLAKEGLFAEALKCVRSDNVLPGICGRICTHPCEEACRRGEIDDPIAIRDIKRFLSDYELSIKDKPEPDTISARRNEKIAIIGSGPSGLAAAADLARSGYKVTVFEKEKEIGGLLRYGIGVHRLPRNILDIDIGYIERLGVAFKPSCPVDYANDPETLDRLAREFDAVIIATGTWADRKLGVPGEDMKGVEGCLAFLTGLYRGDIAELKEKATVIGDGNAAFDLARTLARIGADVTLVSWFPEHLIPADKDEIKAAREEGISIICSAKTIEFAGKNGRLEKIICKPTEPGKPDANGIPWPVIVKDGKPFDLAFDRAFVAIGQKSPLQNPEVKGNITVSRYGYIKTDDHCRTNIKKVYAAGDAGSGPSSVVKAMASGRYAALTVHHDICEKNKRAPVLIGKTSRPDKDFMPIPDDIPHQARPAMPEKQPAARVNNFSEVALGLSESQVFFETGRCLQCGICSECLQCVDACGPVGAVNHGEAGGDIIEHAGVLIIADPDMAPAVKGEDVIRAYGPKAARPDVYDMIVRGFASAAHALILLGATSRIQKGRGLSFSPPDTSLSPDIRIGVFVCKCNNALGWLDGMDRYMDHLKQQTDIVHAEAVNAACVPDGATGIIRTIREKGVTRVVLASCVCCPLNFICSSCTDQRSRLKDMLFTGTGITRSMVEACNLRGEVLRLIKENPSLAVDRFGGLLERSVNRARKLKMLPVSARDYNFNTAVIGESEAVTSSVMTLAAAGFEVFWFGMADRPVIEMAAHPNVQIFEKSRVTGITGTLGNFQIFAESGGFRQSLQVGAVILGEKSRKNIHYIQQEGLPGMKVSSAIQEEGVLGIPFFYPGATAIPGLYLADPPGLHVSNKKKGAAAALHATAVMPRGPRQSKGFIASIDETKCRGCGRCAKACPYQAVTLRKNSIGGWFASVDVALCKGCGNCISVCPSNAADSPYRNQNFLEVMIEELLEQ